MIIGTAGHIDHGKTTLVRALTGIDTDRLQEEKARGISIELGYAYTPLPGGDVLGFVDVPGHERLVHTMVAGACGIDFALLVIAADDGVMPQTREHLAILQLLGVTRGAVALTKADRVSQERLQGVEAETGALLAPTPLAGSRIFPLNATDPTDPGTQSIRNYLHGVAATLPLHRDQRLFRLAVDRVFTLSGHGTVVTGTVFSGEVRTGEPVVIMPSGKPARVRSIHAQSQAADTGRAGQRCALNLSGIETTEVRRGDWIADRRAFAPTTRIDVRLELLALGRSSGPWGDRPRGDPARMADRLGPWAPVHVHLATAHQVAHLVPLQANAVRCGESTFAQLVFETPICATPGDRLILRNAQATHTIGGGVVLDPYAPSRKRRSPERLRRLDDLETLIAGGGVGTLLLNAPLGLPMSELVRLSALPPGRLGLPEDCLVIHCADEPFVIHRMQWSRLRERALEVLREFHARVPDEPGPDVSRLRRMVVPDLPEPLWRALIDELVRASELNRQGPWLSLPGHRVELSEEDQALTIKLQPLIAGGGFDPPWVRDLAAAVGQPEEHVRAVLRKAVTHGALYQVVRDLFYDRERVGELAAIAGRIAHEQGSVSAARYRDAVGLGRKRAIQILEFFDRVGYTRRVKDSHVLRREWE